MPGKRDGGAESPYIRHIVSTLEERIRTGAYPAGRWLPTERELCLEFDVSRGTLRQALIELERNSLVIRSAGCRPLVKSGLGPGSGLKEAVRRTVGLCAKHDPQYSGTYLITQGVRESVNSDTFRLVIAGSGANTLEAVAAEEAQSLLRLIRDEDIAGIVLWYCGGSANRAVIQEVQRANIPLIFVDREPPDGIDADYVSIDNRRAAREAVSYLIRLGHRRIAHITNPEPDTRGGGLLNVEATAGGTAYEESGKSLAAIVAPAQTFAFGDSYDTPRMGFAMTFLACTWNGTSNSSLRHSGGHFNVSFADGHAKAVYYRAGYMNPSAENGRYIRPRDSSMIADYCANPDDTISNDVAPYNDNLPIPTLQCSQIGAYFDANFNAPCNGAMPSSGGCSLSD